MNKHTEGPWSYEEPDGWGDHEVCGADGCRVATVECKSSAFAPDDEIGKANAILIASAPELLEALTLAEDVLSRFPYSAEIWPNGMHPMTGITQIRDAIAKATGG